MLMVDTPFQCKQMLQRYVEAYWDSVKTFRLYTNNFTPIHGMVFSDFTEPTDPLYGPKVVDPWHAIVETADCAWMDAAILTWTFSLSGGPFSIYGYFVYDLDNDAVLWAQKLAAPVLISLAGQPFSVRPYREQSTETASCV